MQPSYRTLKGLIQVDALMAPSAPPLGAGKK